MGLAGIDAGGIVRFRPGRDMGDKVAEPRLDDRRLAPVLTVNAEGGSPFVLVCDHASNHIPAHYAGLGLPLIEQLRHIAWDPGALAVSQELVRLLDAPLVQSTISRLVIDCNRQTTAPDLIWTLSEATEITANIGLGATERDFRIARYHQPFHAAIAALLDRRLQRGRRTIVVCVHSFTPVYLSLARPWPIGLIHGADITYTAALRDAIEADDPRLQLGWNQPYAALNGVTPTLEKHGDGRGLDATMIEIRNDEILEPDGVARWSALLARWLERARLTLDGQGSTDSPVNAVACGA